MKSKIKRLNCQMMGKLYMNNKTKNIYRITFVAFDATNEREGSPIVLYEPHSYFEIDGIIFARDYEEFKIKFTPHKI